MFKYPAALLFATIYRIVSKNHTIHGKLEYYYQRKLKKIKVVRRLNKFGWKIYTKHEKRGGFSSAQIESKVRINKTLFSKTFAEASIIKVKGPRFINYSLNTIHRELKKLNVVSPEIKVNEYRDVFIFGITNFIGKGKKLYIDNCINKKEYLNNKEYEFIKRVGLKNKISFIKNNTIINKGIRLTGQCSGNYIHWITEILPKLAFINDMPEYNGYPLIIDKWNHPIFEQSARLISFANRSVIYLSKHERVKVTKLVDVTATAHIPISVCREIRGVSPYMFSKAAMEKLRSAAVNKLSTKHQCVYAGKIYLKRSAHNSGNGRHLVNSESLESLASEFGYQSIDPADLSFESQVKLFLNATHIISPIGATLANLVFTSKPSKIMILSPHYKSADYSFFSLFFGVLNHSYRFLVGNQVSNSEFTDENANYYISKKIFRNGLFKMQEISF